MVRLRTLFIFTVFSYDTTERPLSEPTQIQFGISHISSLLKSEGYETSLLVLTRDTKQEVIDKHINSFMPGLICFTSIESEYDFVAKTAKHIKSVHPSTFLLVGGAHVSLSPELALNGLFDAICVGEGEYATLNLVRQLENNKVPTGIKNLWIKKDKEIEKNVTAEFIPELDKLPFPDRNMWKQWITRPGNKHVILLGRGCPFSCTYCSNHALKKLAVGNYVRFRTVTDIMGELEELVKECPDTEEVYFEVETIGVNKPFALELCSELEKFNKKHAGIVYGVNLRITPSNDYTSLFKAFKKAGFGYVNIGLESGSKKVREEHLKRFYSNDDVINAVRLAKKTGLEARLFVMVGLPGETLKDFKATVRCCVACQPTMIYSGVFFPYSGTEMYGYCEKNKLLPKNIRKDGERVKATMNLPGFSKKQIQKEYAWFNYNVYKNHRPVTGLLLDVLFRTLSSNNLINLINNRLRITYMIRKMLGGYGYGIL